MSREIKFRVWHKNSKEYLKLGYSEHDTYRDNLLEISFRPEPIVVSSVFGELDERYRDVDVVIEQYTGLKDKNGKEIYEGDILTSNNHHYWEVIWKNWYWAIEINDDWFIEHESNIQQMTCAVYNTHEVVGNIHEHGDLLK
jgi:uncharacterized phage protein (TIGR01671 family)